MSSVSDVTCGISGRRRLAMILTAFVVAFGLVMPMTVPANAASVARALPVAAPATPAALAAGSTAPVAPAAIGSAPTAPLKWATGLTMSPKTVKKGAKVTAKVTLRIAGKPASAKVRLQVKKSGAWTTLKTVRVKKGKGSYTFKPNATRTYRTAYAALRSAPVTVKVRATKAAPKPAAKPAPKPAVKPAPKPAAKPAPKPAAKPAPKVTAPASFTVKGSGFGHGIGMAQYGAYYLALQGKSVEQILGTYYAGAKVGYRSVTGDTRVQLYQASSADVYVSGGRVKLSGPGLSANNAVYPAGSTIKLRAASGGKINVYRGSAKLGTLPAGQRLAVMWENTRYFSGSARALAYVRKAGSASSATHGYYRYGRFEVSNIGGRVNVVNVLKTNTEYLYGLGEMPSSWGMGKGSAALQAQAVAARNYALINSSRNSGCDCNVYDDTRSQYFSGYAKEASYAGDYWRAAVDKTVSGTSGKVMTVSGQLVRAYYYSASGGATLNSEDVWLSKVPYLRSVSDPYSLWAPGNSNATWSATVSQARVKALFPGLKNVASLSVSAKYAGGAAKTLRAVDTNGKVGYYTAKADTIRGKLGLKAAWIKSFTRR